jgi:hypothetical protein
MLVCGFESGTGINHLKPSGTYHAPPALTISNSALCPQRVSYDSQSKE